MRILLRRKVSGARNYGTGESERRSRRAGAEGQELKGPGPGGELGGELGGWGIGESGDRGETLLRSHASASPYDTILAPSPCSHLFMSFVHTCVCLRHRAVRRPHRPRFLAYVQGQDPPKTALPPLPLPRPHPHVPRLLLRPLRLRHNPLPPPNSRADRLRVPLPRAAPRPPVHNDH